MDELASIAATKKERSAPREAVRSGRPPREFAGEVEERILDAARKVFLDRGFEAATIEEIADTARSGKPTIYARFPNKQAIFAAAVTRSAFAKLSRFEDFTPTGATIEERLVNIGVTILQEALTSEWIGLFRLAIGEARRFPDLGSVIVRVMRERGGESVARLLGEAAESAGAGTLPGFRPDRLAATAGFFRDLIVLPHILRALSGERLDTLRAEIGPHVSPRIAFFLAACRHDGVD